MELIDFIIEAKLHSYASAGERDESLLEDGGKQFRYRRGAFEYRDRYYGNDPFFGEEVVWQNGRAVWGMNFYGLVLDANVPSKDVYTFLQQAMRQVRPERPYRGPERFSSGDWEYQDASQGDVERFNGSETICYQGREVYRLLYHGGKIG
jgi:hypothetical protein